MFHHGLGKNHRKFPSAEIIDHIDFQKGLICNGLNFPQKPFSRKAPAGHSKS
jgi:hypothetical protein